MRFGIRQILFYITESFKEICLKGSARNAVSGINAQQDSGRFTIFIVAKCMKIKYA